MERKIDDNIMSKMHVTNGASSDDSTCILTIARTQINIHSS